MQQLIYNMGSTPLISQDMYLDKYYQKYQTIFELFSVLLFVCDL